MPERVGQHYVDGDRHCGEFEEQSLLRVVLGPDLSDNRCDQPMAERSASRFGKREVRSEMGKRTTHFERRVDEY